MRRGRDPEHLARSALLEFGLAEDTAVTSRYHRRHAMLTADDFRRIALGMKEVVERAHMGHPDFRVRGRIFATLHADHHWGMVALTPDQQAAFIREKPSAFKPENGAWGRQGCTAVRLDSIDEETLGEVLTLAWQAGVAKGPPRKRQPSRKAR